MIHQRKFSLILTIGIFGIIYCSISLVNHYLLRTYGWDLGIINNSMFDYAHFRWNNGEIMYPNSKFDNLLGDHFTLYPLIISPLSWIFGTYTLLLFQVAAILWGGYGVYKFVYQLNSNHKLALLSTIQFYSIFGIYSALGFDYHDNVIAAMFVPWLLYYFHKEDWLKASIYLVLILIGKENMALWAFFISIGTMMLYYKERKKVIYSCIFAAASIVYFIGIMKLMPTLSPAQTEYAHWDFSALGPTMGDAFETIFTRPKYVFTLLLENHLNIPEGIGSKSELHYVVLLSGGIALIYRPQFLIMLLPIYGQKLFNDQFARWGICHHYSIEFAPILAIATGWMVNDLTIKDNRKFWLAIAFTLLTIATTLSILDSRVSKYFNKDNERFYAKRHWTRKYDVKLVYNNLHFIPSDAALSAQSMLCPHLAFREKIYHYPYIGDAEYIALLPKDQNVYPLTKEEYRNRMQELRNNPEWVVVVENESLIVFKRVLIVKKENSTQ